LSDSLTSKDLQDYFAQFGQVIDVYIPKPFRAFGFVTFVEADIAQSLCGESHIINGVSVHVSRADPKDDDQSNHGGHTQSHSKDSQQNHYHQGNNHRNESYKRYSSNSQFSGTGFFLILKI
jgi:RNA recognition motif-containing protein